MSDAPYADRKRLTFEQAEGVDPSPAQLPPKEIFQQLAAALWAVVYESVMKTTSYDGFHSRLGCDWTEIRYDYHVYHEHWPRMPITMLHNR
jgi:hypothetical protein